MTRHLPEDEENTRNRLNGDDRCEIPSWLGHKTQRGAVIDHLLLCGATVEEMMEKSGAGTRGSVHGHLSHLRAKAPDGHGLPVRYDRDSESYYFDFDQ